MSSVCSLATQASPVYKKSAILSSKAGYRSRQEGSKPSGVAHRHPLSGAEHLPCLGLGLGLRLRFNFVVDPGGVVVYRADTKYFNRASFHQQGQRMSSPALSSLDTAADFNHATSFCSDRTEPPVPRSPWPWYRYLPRRSCWHRHRSSFGPFAGIFLASRRSFLPTHFHLFRRWLAVCFLEDAAVPHRQPQHPLHHPPLLPCFS
jgi:hypothetical protein